MEEPRATMENGYPRMIATAGQAYAAFLSASLEVGVRAMRAVAVESGAAAARAADALDAPPELRATATEEAMWRALDGHRRLLHGIGGLPTLWGMAFLHALDLARRHPPSA